MLQMLLHGLPTQQQPQLTPQVRPTTTACNSHDVIRNESRQYGNHMPSPANRGDFLKTTQTFGIEFSVIIVSLILCWKWSRNTSYVTVL